MKVILSVEALGPQLSGIGRYTLELASRLPASGQVESLRLYRNKRWVKELGPLLAGEKVLPRSWPKVVADWLLPSKVEKGEVFHGPNYFLPDFVEGGVATIHDLSVFRFPETHPPQRLVHFEREFKQSLKRAAHLITDTETVRQEVIGEYQWPPEKITAVPLGVSSTFRPQPPESIASMLAVHHLEPGGFALCVSTIEPRKKIDRLLAAYSKIPAALRRQHPLVLIGGDGWLNESLHNEIETARQQGWLKYLGFVPEAEMAAIYAGARAFMFPSVYEGFGLPVIEAMASGVPVVTSNRSCLPEISNGAALLVNPDDVDALGAAIQRSLEDDLWRASAIAAGLRVAGELTWDRCVQKTVDVYAKVLAAE